MREVSEQGFREDVISLVDMETFFVIPVEVIPSDEFRLTAYMVYDLVFTCNQAFNQNSCVTYIL